MYLSNLFTNHCVLQREKSIPVWGWTNAPRTKVTASLNGATVYGISGDDCKFLLRLPPMQHGKDHILEVKTEDGNESVTVNDVVIGDVWLASGQSNMEWEVEKCFHEDTIENAVPENIRMIKVKKRADLAPQETFEGEWQLATPDTIGEFSAVANYFGQRLQDETGIPIGIINSSWGGTFIETWISREKLLQNPYRKEWLESYELASGSGVTVTPAYPEDPGNEGLEKGWAESEFDDENWDTMKLPAHWQFHGHNYSGVFWFRKTVNIDANWTGKELTLQPGCLDKQDITYVNGVEVGRTGTGLEEKYWDSPREYKIPAELVSGKTLTIAVRVYSFSHNGGMIGPGKKMLLKLDDENRISLAGEWKYQVEHNFGIVNVQQSMGHTNPNSPYMCFENMIKPLLPATVKGFIWYQGESNAGAAKEYGRLMRNLIEDWRFRFGDDKLPFIQVQLANYMAEDDFQFDSNWALLRDQQKGILEEMKNTGMAVIIDAGEAADIHPKDKKTVGKRLAQWALANCYGKLIIQGSPLYSHQSIEGNRIRIYFKDTGSELRTSDGGKVKCVYIARADGDFKPADAIIDGTTLVVSHSDITDPVAVRYAWANNPANANLVNEIGYPASPFKTDPI